MVEESKPNKKKIETKEMKDERVKEKKNEESKDVKTDISKEITKNVDKTVKEEKKAKTPKKVKKDVAIANGYSIRISPKYSIAICKVLRGKSPEEVVKRLEEVIAMKRAIPMAGLEVGHKKGKGMSGGKYPKNACVAIIEVIRQVGANAIVNEIEDPIIVVAKSNQASAPQRRGGRSGKRTHIYLEVRSKKSFLLNKKTKQDKKSR